MEAPREDASTVNHNPRLEFDFNMRQFLAQILQLAIQVSWILAQCGLNCGVTYFCSVFGVASQAELSHALKWPFICYNIILCVPFCLVSVLDLAWCSFQAWECTPGKELTWDLLSLSTTSGMLFLEVKLLVFLLQGHNASGLEASTRTFVVSVFVVGLDVFLKAVYLFGFGIPLFIDINNDMQPIEWTLWVVHKLLLTVVYGVILFMYHSRWRERLPARPAFYKLYSTTVVLYHAFCLPLLYTTFLADFFQEEDLHLENVYNSEMKDAGFFGVDWE